MDSDIIHIAAQMKHLEKQMGDMDDKLSRVLWTLTGNELDKNDNGFVGKVKELEIELKEQRKEIEALKRFKDRAIWLVIGASATTGFGISKLIELITKH